jgi:hypothetical protein
MGLLLATSATFAQIAIKGQILQDHTITENYDLEIIVNGEETHQIPLSKKGKYHVIVYENDTYTFNFMEEGRLVKSVILDTSSPENISPTGSIKFDVAVAPNEMFLADEVNMITLHYSEDDGTFKSVGSKTSYFTADLRVK